MYVIEIKYKGNKDQAFTTTVINSNKNGIGSKKDKNKISQQETECKANQVIATEGAAVVMKGSCQSSLRLVLQQWSGSLYSERMALEGCQQGSYS